MAAICDAFEIPYQKAPKYFDVKIETGIDRLRKRIRTNYKTDSDFAAVLGMSKYALSRRLRGQYHFTENEKINICLILNIPLSDKETYFALGGK